MKALLLAAALGGAMPILAPGAHPKPQILRPWARATLPGQDSAAAYATLRSDVGDALLSVESDQGQAMLHRTMRAGGMSDMEDVDHVPLPPGQDVALAPGGTHIMLMDLPHPLKPGETLRLTFHFARAGAVRATVPVLPARAVGP